MRKIVILVVLSILTALGASGSAAFTAGITKGPLSSTEPQTAVAAFPSGSWISGIQAQNLSASIATVVLTLYNEAGAEIFSTGGTAPANGSATFYLPGYVSLASGRYSAVVSSDQPVAVVTNQVNTSAGMADNYLGTSAGSTTLNLPLAFRNPSGGWNSLVAVQNTSDSTSANVSLNFFPAGSSTSALTKNATIPANASAFFDLSATEYNTALGTFVGSIVVTSTQPVAAVINNTSANALAMFTGVTTAGTSHVAPLVYDNYGGSNWLTGIMVLNKGATSANVTMVYKISAVSSGGDAANIGKAYTKTLSIAGNSSDTFYMPGYGDIPSKSVGSATITSDGNNIAVVVNNVSGGVSTGYNAFLAGSGTAEVITPLVFKARGGWTSGVQVYNMGGSSTTVSMAYTLAEAPGTTSTNSQSIDPGQSKTFYMPAFSGPADGTYGSAVLTSSGGVPVVAIVNSVGPGVATSYAGINVTP